MNFQHQLNVLEKEISDKVACLNLSLIGNSIDHEKTSFDNIVGLLVSNGYMANEIKDWQLLNDDLAQAYFVKLFSKSMAYSTDLCSVSEAQQYWNIFSGILDDKPLFYANFSDLDDVQDFIDGTSYGSPPVTQATFDQALLFIGRTHILGIIVTDED